jgi:uncharacterized SAM-binding protein YcdF (DUF218 family)
MLWLLQLKTVVRMLILPPAGPLLLAILGILLLRRRPHLGRACLMVSIASLWLLSTPWVSDVLSSWVEHYPPVDLHAAGEAQAIVILGGGGQREFAPEYGGPAAEPVLLERLDYGAYLARKTGLPILVTGFRIEAIAMSDTLTRDFSVTPRWVDGQAYDTFQNARNAAHLLQAEGISRVVLITRAAHMWRSVHEFMAAGMEVVPAPVGILTRRNTNFSLYLPDLSALERSTAAVYELLGETVRRFLAVTHLRRQ